MLQDWYVRIPTTSTSVTKYVFPAEKIQLQFFSFSCVTLWVPLEQHWVNRPYASVVGWIPVPHSLWFDWTWSNSPSDSSISTQSKQRTCVATYRAYLRLGTYAKGAAACALGAASGFTCAKICHSKIVSPPQNLATLCVKICAGTYCVANIYFILSLHSYSKG